MREIKVDGTPLFVYGALMNVSFPVTGGLSSNEILLTLESSTDVTSTIENITIEFSSSVA